MKIFHTENGKEVAYIQIQDIIYLSHMKDTPISKTTFQKAFTTADRFEFMRFEDEQEVMFFKNLNFILDFDQYKNYSYKQLKKEMKKLAKQGNEINKKWNRMTEEERKQNAFLYYDYYNIVYTIQSLQELYGIKHHLTTPMPFPYFVDLPEKSKKRPFFTRI